MSQSGAGIKTVIGAILLTGVCNGVLSALLLRDSHFALPVILTISASVLALFRSKLTWTGAITWLVLAIVLLVDANLSQVWLKAETAQQTLLSWVLCFNAGVLICILVSFFKPPYVNARSSLIDFGGRKRVEIPGVMKSGEQEFQVLIRDLSVRGALIEVDPDGRKALAFGKSILLHVPNLLGLKISARVVHLKGETCGVQFRGWTPRSAYEQAKLLFWMLTSRGPKTLRSDGGFTLGEAVIVSAISGIVIIATATLLLDLTKVKRLNDIQNQLHSLKAEFTQIMRHQVAWQNTVNDADNVALACVRQRTACTATDFSPINLRSFDNSVRLRSRVQTAGFTITGGACDAFNTASGNDQCPIRFVIEARPICDSDCVNPVVELRLRAFFRPRTNTLALNEERFGTTVFRDPLIDSLAANCTSMNGVFDSANGSCNLTLLSETCRTNGEYLAGIVNGRPVCRAVTGSAQCPRGSYLKGFSVGGDIECVSL